MLSRQDRLEVSQNVRYVHYHAQKGGTVTIATVRDPNNPCISFFGFAYCSPKDQFMKSKGREKSFRRLMEGLGWQGETIEWLHTDSCPHVISFARGEGEIPEKPFERSMLALSAVVKSGLSPKWLKEIEND